MATKAAISLLSVGQLLVESATLAAIDIGAKDATEKYNRATVALQVAAAFQAVQAGDLAGGLAEAQAALLSKITDPGQILLIQGLFTIGNAQIQIASQAASAIPLLNATVEGVAGEIAAGITAIASSYKNPANKTA